jgi:4-deoxy-L-threo-5-hexosulose-uronate ketol-isomerase
MEIRYATGKDQYQRMTTEELRKHFLVEHLFTPGKTELVYWETERTVIGGIMPTAGPIPLGTEKELASEFFCERRELAAFNLGGAGDVVVDGHRYNIGPHDAIYIGRGSKEISFGSIGSENPAKYYLISYPAHAVHPTRAVPKSGANKLELGTQPTANERSLYQYIHEAGAPSCQLVAGMTQLKTGSIWNTMPPHTHLRRSEVYLYFAVPENAAVIHFMGTGDETRHIMMKSEQAVLSPSWSIHCGCATEAYSFVWAMGGENQRFTDMDGIAVNTLK